MSLIPNFSGYFIRGVRDDVSELYQSSAIANFAVSLVVLFEPIFLYHVLGYSVPQVLLFFGMVYVFYIFLIPLGGKVASIYGYRHSIALAVPFQLFFWFALLESVEHPYAAILAALMLALNKSFYWPGFHSVIARYAQSGQVGREFGAAYAISNLSQIGGPLLGGIVAQYVGLPAVFFLTSVIYCFSIIPLLSAKEIFIPKHYLYKDTLDLFKTFPKKFVAYTGFGEEILGLTIWPVFIYLIVKDYKDTGLLAATASLFAVIFALLLGGLSDKHAKHKLVKIGTIGNFVFWLTRIFASNFLSVFFMDTAGKAAKETLFVPLTTLTYLRAEQTHIVPYSVFFEQSLAIGKLSACLLGALLFYLTGSFVVLFILGALYSLLYLYI